ncbi:MAG: TIGR03619 family F420-dependent LLM class oxidoreductase [Burkholderiales bacterium]|nr:TIGR03619 family F420-dependent LLM class oxidoreductase [Burkholderiales bacterium]
MKFSVGLPTGMEGLTYPVPFATPEQIIEIAKFCERLGYDSVWGNDHMTTQTYVRREFPEPPNYWEILVTYAFVCAATTTLRVGTSMLVLPLRRDIVVTAKQIATLDQFSNGRLEIGIGIGAYREEFHALHPGWEAHRGDMVTEGIQALRMLFSERRCTFEGKYYRFRDVELYPKPLQQTLPLLIGGNSVAGTERAGRYADGYIPACQSPKVFGEGVKRVREAAYAAGRDPDAIEMAPQLALYIARTHNEAVRRFEQTQMCKHLNSLAQSTLKDQGTRSHAESNIIGSVEECIERSNAYKEAGADHLLGLFIAANSYQELVDQIQLYAEEVMPHVK